MLTRDKVKHEELTRKAQKKQTTNFHLQMFRAVGLWITQYVRTVLSWLTVPLVQQVTETVVKTITITHFLKPSFSGAENVRQRATLSPQCVLGWGSAEVFFSSPEPKAHR